MRLNKIIFFFEHSKSFRSLALEYIFQIALFELDSNVILHLDTNISKNASGSYACFRLYNITISITLLLQFPSCFQNIVVSYDIFFFNLTIYNRHSKILRIKPSSQYISLWFFHLAAFDLSLCGKFTLKAFMESHLTTWSIINDNQVAH